MRSMVANGEADALVPERVWQEFSRGLMEGDAALMFPVLAEAGLLEKLLPRVEARFRARPAGETTPPAFSSARSSARRRERLGLAPRFRSGRFRRRSHAQATRALSERFKAPGDWPRSRPARRRHGRDD